MRWSYGVSTPHLSCTAVWLDAHIHLVSALILHLGTHLGTHRPFSRGFVRDRLELRGPDKREPSRDGPTQPKVNGSDRREGAMDPFG